MNERRLFPQGPVANRDSLFRDASGQNAYRDIETPVPAEVADEGGATSSATGSAIPTAGGTAYSSPTAPGMRKWGAGDFVATRRSTHGYLVWQSGCILLAVALGWAAYAVVWLGWIHALWIWFLTMWFWAAFLIGGIGAWTAVNESYLAQIGVIDAADARPLCRAKRVSLMAAVLAGISAAGIVTQLVEWF